LISAHGIGLLGLHGFFENFSVAVGHNSSKIANPRPINHLQKIQMNG
jgi:hypothetical protein